MTLPHSYMGSLSNFSPFILFTHPIFYLKTNLDPWYKNSRTTILKAKYSTATS